MLEYLLSGLNDGLIIYSYAEQKNTVVNAAVSEISGYAVNDFKTDTSLWTRLIEANDRDEVILLAQSIKPGEWQELTYRIRSADGKIKWIKDRQLLVREEEKAVLINILTDITDLRTVNFKLRDSVGDFSVLFDRNPNPMWIYEIPSLRILKVNEAAIEHYGFNEKEFLSMTIRDIRPRIDLARFNDYLYRKGFGKKFSGFNHGGVWRHQNKKGEIIYAEITGHEVKYGNTVCRIIVAANVTERVHYQEEVNRREQFLTSLIDSQTTFLIRIDSKHNITFANNSFHEAIGYTREELSGKSFMYTTFPEEQDKCLRAFNNAILTGQTVRQVRHRIRSKTGEIRWVEWDVIPIFNSEGYIVELQGVGRDVTNHIEAQKEVRQTMEKLNAFIDSITDLICVIDMDWKFMKVNSAFERITGKHRREVIGKSVWEIFSGIEGTVFERSLRQSARERVSLQFEDFFKPLNLWFRATAYPSAEGLTLFIKDVTFEKAIQEEVSWTKDNLEALINNTDDLIWSVDADSRYVYMNTAYKNRVRKLSGKAPERGDYIHTHTNYAESVVKEWRSYYERAFSGVQFTFKRENVDTLTGKTYYSEINFNPIYNAESKVTGVGCFARDITHRLEAERAIMKQNEHLRHIASLSSHELRRPVASMIGLLNLLNLSNLNTPGNIEVLSHLQTVAREIDEVIHQIVEKAFIENLGINEYQGF